MKVEFVVEGKPKGKARPRFTKSGHCYTPVGTSLYEKAVKEAWEKAGAVHLEGTIKMTVNAVFPIPKSWNKEKREQARYQRIQPTVKPDIDNILKVIEDALNGYAYDDDKQICEVESCKVYEDCNGRVVVKIEEI